MYGGISFCALRSSRPVNGTPRMPCTCTQTVVNACSDKGPPCSSGAGKVRTLHQISTSYGARPTGPAERGIPHHQSKPSRPPTTLKLLWRDSDHPPKSLFYLALVIVKVTVTVTVTVTGTGTDQSTCPLCVPHLIP